MAGEDKKVKRVWDFSDLALVFFIFGTLLVLIIPVHQIMMDLLLAVSLALALLILLVILFLKIFRVVLNGDVMRVRLSYGMIVIPFKIQWN